MESRALLLKEDADFFVEVNCNGQPETTNGFLLRRCAFSLTSPEGVECVGGYERRVNGKWAADIHRHPEHEDDSDVEALGEFDTREMAVVALWQARTNAATRHPRY